MSYDLKDTLSYDSRMSNSEYKKAFLGRTKQARKDARLTQTQIAELLGIAQDTYKQYETRSLLPHELIRRFCMATGVTEEWLIGGTGRPKKRGEAESRTAAQR